jgi:hypothetical protein
MLLSIITGQISISIVPGSGPCAKYKSVMRFPQIRYVVNYTPVIKAGVQVVRHLRNARKEIHK